MVIDLPFVFHVGPGILAYPKFKAMRLYEILDTRLLIYSYFVVINANSAKKKTDRNRFVARLTREFSVVFELTGTDIDISKQGQSVKQSSMIFGHAR